jgi:hypothetical protein
MKSGYARDDRKERVVGTGRGVTDRNIFMLIGGPQAHPTTRDGKNGRVVGSGREVTEPKRFLLIGGTQAHDHSGNDRGEQ